MVGTYPVDGRPARALRIDSVTRLNEAGLIGVNDGLYTIAHTEFGEDAGDVGLDGTFGEVEVCSDLSVGHAGGDESQHLGFTVGQRFDGSTTGAPARRSES